MWLLKSVYEWVEIIVEKGENAAFFFSSLFFYPAKDKNYHFIYN